MKKSDFIISLNKAILEMIKPEYKPDIKDMFSSNSKSLLLEKCFEKIKKDKDILSVIEKNINDIKHEFVIHFQNTFSDDKKTELLIKNSKIRLDSIDIDDKLDILNSQKINTVINYIFIL